MKCDRCSGPMILQKLTDGMDTFESYQCGVCGYCDYCGEEHKW